MFVKRLFLKEKVLNEVKKVRNEKKPTNLYNLSANHFCEEMNMNGNDIAQGIGIFFIGFFGIVFFIFGILTIFNNIKYSTGIPSIILSLALVIIGFILFEKSKYKSVKNTIIKRHR